MMVQFSCKRSPQSSKIMNTERIKNIADRQSDPSLGLERSSASSASISVGGWSEKTIFKVVPFYPQLHENPSDTPS
jgi:hypothetical protein